MKVETRHWSTTFLVVDLIGRLDSYTSGDAGRSHREYRAGASHRRVLLNLEKARIPDQCGPAGDPAAEPSCCKGNRGELKICNAQRRGEGGA